MSDLIETIQKAPPPEIPKDWDYKESVKRSLILRDNWKYITIKRATEYFIAHKKLAKEGNPHKNSTGRFLPVKTWTDYCADCKVDRHTPLEWFKKLGWLPSNILALKHTGNQENYTPAIVIDRVRQVLGEIDLDPASCDFAQKTIQAKKYYTVEDNGLEQNWEGRIFLNPPYNMPEIELFTDKLLKSTFESAILLTNNNTDTNWFYKCAVKASTICFTKGRINFYTVDIEKTQPTNGQAFFYFGKDINSFCEVFYEAGLIMRIL